MTVFELRDRVRRVHEAKREKAARGLGTDLTPEELDRILPPVDCRRTRERLLSLRELKRSNG